MDKCSICGKNYPEATLKKMVQISGRKAYLNQICPACQAIVLNNPSYYYLEEKAAKKNN